jgi:putative cardiolipin synthase
MTKVDEHLNSKAASVNVPATVDSNDLAGMPARLTLLVLAALMLIGCATTLPTDYKQPVSTALSDPEETELGRTFNQEISAHPGSSGVVIVPTGEWGFRARSGLSNQAERTIDVQYYIWEQDLSGMILAERLLRAADRGVRVRMLLDHITTGTKDLSLARMDQHRNIEVRLFNPFKRRAFRSMELLFGLKRLNHRMHNKAFIVDNAIAIVGGRNIGDSYFGIGTADNFRDLDLTVVGPVVQDISASFDKYWNSEHSVPVSAVIGDKFTEEELAKRQMKLYHWVSELDDFPYPIDNTSESVTAKLKELRGDFIWAPAQALYDEPDKLRTYNEDVMSHMIELGKHKESELLVESAYVIPGPENIERARINNEKGIRQRLLTNSLATNDVAAAHAGYAKYRRDLIRNGVEVYELRPDAASEKKNWSLLAGRSKASLHTKAAVIDQEIVLVGSFNLDPRSTALNTEIVILVKSSELAGKVIEFMDDGVQAQNSYRVILETNSESGTERLVWLTEIDGKQVRYYTEPEVGFWRRFSTWFIGLLPMEKHL